MPERTIITQSVHDAATISVYDDEVPVLLWNDNGSTYVMTVNFLRRGVPAVQIYSNYPFTDIPFKSLALAGESFSASFAANVGAEGGIKAEGGITTVKREVLK